MFNRFLFLSIDGMTDQLGQSQVLPYLIGLSGKGYRISIVSCEKEVNFEKNKDIICVWQYPVRSRVSLMLTEIY